MEAEDKIKKYVAWLRPTDHLYLPQNEGQEQYNWPYVPSLHQRRVCFENCRQLRTDEQVFRGSGQGDRVRTALDDEGPIAQRAQRTECVPLVA